MLSWYKHLYVGDNAKKNIAKIKRHLNRGKVLDDIYLITIASNQVDQLDIMKCYYLFQSSLYMSCPMIVGVAKGQDEAHQLLICMLEDALRNAGTANIKDYLLQR